MAYQRAQWHSGLTYRQTCRNCSTTVEYTDHSLGFRPWYADGFIYCTNCKTPLRHSETYAINAPAPQVTATPAPAPAPTPVAEPAPAPVAEPAPQTVTPEPVVTPAAPVCEEVAAFCTQCGRKANPGDRFCAGCGNKLA